jgi:hypothetical protein
MISSYSEKCSSGLRDINSILQYNKPRRSIYSVRNYTKEIEFTDRRRGRNFGMHTRSRLVQRSMSHRSTRTPILSTVCRFWNRCSPGNELVFNKQSGVRRHESKFGNPSGVCRRTLNFDNRSPQRITTVACFSQLSTTRSTVVVDTNVPSSFSTVS